MRDFDPTIIFFFFSSSIFRNFSILENHIVYIQLNVERSRSLVARQIERCTRSTIRDLGIIFDSLLIPRKHSSYVYRQIVRRIRILSMGARG